MGDSDNTAADLLMKRIGGPGAVTAWLQSKKIDEIRVDRYERELQPDVVGMASFRAGLEGRRGLRRPPRPRCRPRGGSPRRHAAYMADPRDSATPRGMLGFLRKLDEGELISPAVHRAAAGHHAAAARAGPSRIKAGLPQGRELRPQDRHLGPTDLGLHAAYNDVGIFTLADRPQLRHRGLPDRLDGARARPRRPVRRPRPRPAAQSVG